jgi:putative FmdB family regulatory protein
MPIYDYTCSICGEFKPDQLVKSSKEVVLCSCGKPMDRVLCAPQLMGFDKFGSSKTKKP